MGTPASAAPSAPAAATAPGSGGGRVDPLAGRVPRRFQRLHAVALDDLVRVGRRLVHGAVARRARPGAARPARARAGTLRRLLRHTVVAEDRGVGSRPLDLADPDQLLLADEG